MTDHNAEGGKKGKCDICERECGSPSWHRIMSDTPVYCCKTCKVIWYDGATTTEEVRRHSLQWPVDCYGAYRKSSYEIPSAPVVVADPIGDKAKPCAWCGK